MGKVLIETKLISARFSRLMNSLTQNVYITSFRVSLVSLFGKFADEGRNLSKLIYQQVKWKIKQENCFSVHPFLFSLTFVS